MTRETTQEGVVETVEFPVEGGGQILVSVDDRGAGGGVAIRGIGGSAPLQQAEQTFERALGTIRTVAQGVLGQLVGMARSPEEVNVEFRLELTAKAGAILVAGETTAHLKVGLTWRPDDTPPSPPGPEDP